MRACLVTPAIVLRTKPFGESDKIVSFLTERHGKVAGIAKGAKRSRKRFANSLEPFSLVTLRFYDRPHGGLVFILAAELLRSFVNLAGGLEKFSYASYLVEITDGLIGEREENGSVYQHLNDGLRYLSENDASLKFLTSFELKLLGLAGYQPCLDRCKGCARQHLEGAAVRWNFSPSDGGILCERCARSRKETLPLGGAAVTALTQLQATSPSAPVRSSLPSSVVKEIRSVVMRYVQFHVEKEIKSAPFLHRFVST